MFEVVQVVQPYNYVKHGHLHLYFYLKQRQELLKDGEKKETAY